MNSIRDIRVYRSQTENTAGNPLPSQFANRQLHIMLHRIAMKLGEQAFTMGAYHHLYINLTTCAAVEQIAPSARGTDPLHSWYCEYDAEIGQDLYDALETPQCIDDVIAIVEQILTKYYCTAQFDAERIHVCVSDAVSQGAQMLVKFKEKQSAKNKAVIYLRLLDNGRYFPLLRIFDLQDNLLLEQNLPETNTLDAYGTIQLSTKKITVKPRKNSAAVNAEPITVIF